jgi:DNA primase
VETSVATCGTAFGVDHIKTLRRILRDEPGLAPARVVFTFDGDAAGQKAAMRAFEQDQRWASQSYVAVAPAGQDPNELRQSGGDEAVQQLIEQAVPMFEFAVRTTIAPYDLDRAEERVQAMRAAAPILAGIRDGSLRPEYVRTVAGWLGVGVEQVGAEVSRAGRSDKRSRSATPLPQQDAAEETTRPELPAPDLRDPVVRAERQLLQVALQYPTALAQDDLESVPLDSLHAPAHQAVLHGIRAAGGLGGAGAVSGAGAWTGAVAQQTSPAAQPLVHELAVAPLPVTMEGSTGHPPARYVESLLVRVLESGLSSSIGEALSALQRAEPGGPDSRRLNEELTALHRERARLRARTE